MKNTSNKNQKIRDAFVLKVLDKMLALRKHFYTGKRVAWNIGRGELLHYPAGSLGRELGLFLEKENFHSIPTIERHDVFHLLFGFETHVKDEIAMLCFLVGNGKWTPFTLVSAFGASLLYPEHYLYFLHHFRRGQGAMDVRNWDFRPLLNENVAELKDAIFLRTLPGPELTEKIHHELYKTSYC